jgi:predicted dehydrogenase
LSIAGAMAGITLAGSLTSSCKKRPGQKKEDLLEIDFVGPENIFPVYHSYFKKIKRTFLHYKTLDQALFTGSDGAIVFLPLAQKAAVILMLLEMEKDILTPFPLAKDYTEFDAIQKQCNLSDRRIAMMDPVRFWEPVQYISEQLSGKIGLIQRIEFITNSRLVDENNVPSASNYTGNIGGMIRLISCILRMNPFSLINRSTDHLINFNTAGTLNLEIDYNGISLLCRSDNNVNGWTMEFSGDDLYLSLNSEGSVKEIYDKAGTNETRWDNDFKRKALIKNINDFITTILTRKEPEINSLDGMAGIALNLAALESARSGEKSQMIVV